jgi:hypothetical protein
MKFGSITPVICTVEIFEWKFWCEMLKLLHPSHLRLTIKSISTQKKTTRHLNVLSQQRLTEVFSNKFVCLLAFFCEFCRNLALMDPSLYNTGVTMLFYSYLETRKRGI